ncbi:hypothetical protein [Alkaliphilus sp. B6464]|uniref:hypothetical protein n=1 Tax=Alkaliphilus sp. B6464 TaxID=2731219 RepID=UPI001BA746C5|nr:hypothetical protein [Alkaliphilus sp. B6464]QUH20200.1 hypothetical protein HYG84_09970 [Alkaliphilus sp. B6464]
MKKSKLLINLALCLVVLICFSVSVNAETASVVLDASESSDSTDIIGLSDYVNYEAANSPNSLFSVYATVHRSFPGKGWSKERESLMAKGTGSKGKVTATQDANWQLELNPKGWGFIGCEAVGSIWY